MRIINTFRELREQIASTNGKKVPTAKALRESECDVVATASVGHDGELTVYQNGFFLYKAAGKATVGAVDQSGDYQDDDDEGYRLDASIFENEDWTVRLALEGEKRLKHNSDRRNGNTYSYSADDMELGDLRDPSDIAKEYESREMVKRMLACLTDKQRTAVRLYFVDGLTHQQIADLLGSSRQAITKQIRLAIDRLKKEI